MKINSIASIFAGFLLCANCDQIEASNRAPIDPLDDVLREENSVDFQPEAMVPNVRRLIAHQFSDLSALVDDMEELRMDEEDLAMRTEAFLQRIDEMNPDVAVAVPEYPKKLTILFARHPEKGNTVDSPVTARGEDTLTNTQRNFGGWIAKDENPYKKMVTDGNYHFEASVLRRSQIEAVAMMSGMKTAKLDVNKPFYILDATRERGTPWSAETITMWQSASKFERKTMGQSMVGSVISGKPFPEDGKMTSEMMKRYWETYLERALPHSVSSNKLSATGQTLWTSLEPLKDQLEKDIVYKPTPGHKVDIQWYFNTWLKEQMEEKKQKLIIAVGHGGWFIKLVTLKDLYKDATQANKLKDAKGNDRAQLQLIESEIIRIEVELETADATPKISAIPQVIGIMGNTPFPTP